MGWMWIMNIFWFYWIDNFVIIEFIGVFVYFFVFFDFLFNLLVVYYVIKWIFVKLLYLIVKLEVKFWFMNKIRRGEMIVYWILLINFFVLN